MALKIDAAELNYVLAKVFPEVLAVSKLFDFFLRLLKPGSPNKFNISCTCKFHPKFLGYYNTSNLSH